MKKWISVILTLAVLLGVFCACGTTPPAENPSGTAETPSGSGTDPEQDDPEPVTVRLGGLKGPTTMGMVKLLDDADKGLTRNTYSFTMATSADELTPKLLKGELDILAAPANLGAVLYNKSEGGIQTVAVSTLGVLYLVEKGGDSVQSLSDLRGMTLYATGKGTTPEYALTYLLAQNGLELGTDVLVEWKSEPTEVVSQMATMEHAVAMLPQPFVTVAGNQLEDLRIAVDLTEAWNQLENGSQLVTASLLVRKAFAEEHPDLVKTFLEEYAASTEYVNAHPAEAAVLVEQYEIVKAQIAQKAIPYCNLVCITGSEMKEALSGYLDVLYSLNPASVGGAVPEADYYLIYE